MLVLTRYEGQKIVISDTIVLTVLSAKNGKTRIGIDAPLDVQVFREEVFIKRAAEASRLAKQDATIADAILRSQCK